MSSAKHRRWVHALGLSFAAGCGGVPATPSPPVSLHASAPPAATGTLAPPPTSHAVALEEPMTAPVRPPASIVTLAVPGDRSVRVVLGDDLEGPAIVYLHGRCGDPEGFAPWADVAREFGTLVSLEGDVRCKGSHRTKWSYADRALVDRVERAIRAVHAAFPSYTLGGERIVIGYSAGALRAESLLARYPDSFTRGILIAGPRPPHDGSLRRARAALLMAGELDVRAPIAEAALAGAARGEKVSYLEIPGARHGEYGPRAVETMRTALAWLVGGVPAHLEPPPAKGMNGSAAHFAHDPPPPAFAAAKE